MGKSGAAMINFELSDSQIELRDRTRFFIQDQIIPAEQVLGLNEVDDAFRRDLNRKAEQAGLLSPHAPEKYGGLGLNNLDCAIVFEAAGYSLIGPLALNCAAPDEGNVHMLERVATEAQKERWLKPLVTGEIRSCFGMTEPAPGAGSDPGSLQTTVRRDGDDFVVNGRKWLITGAEGARFIIIMARPEDSDEKGQATMLLADMDTPGIHIDRNIPTTDQTFPGGHGELTFDNVRIPAADVLGEPGKGFQYAQVRLAPARLTHCMRWLGAAQRAHDIAAEYASKRDVFGRKLVDHEGVGFMLVDNEIDLRQARLAIWQTAWLIDQGERASREASMTKVFCSEAYHRVADRAQQIMGGLGVTHDTVVARIATEIRSFRIYDGPSEVHRWSLAKQFRAR